MNVLKFFVLLIFLAFLAGCASKKCPAPGLPNHTDGPCYYTLQITEVDKAKGMVKAKVHPRVLKRNKDSAKEEGLVYDYTNYPGESEYSFIVDDTTGIEVGDEEVKFIRKPSDSEETYNNTLEKYVPTVHGSKKIQ